MIRNTITPLMRHRRLPLTVTTTCATGLISASIIKWNETQPPNSKDCHYFSRSTICSSSNTNDLNNVNIPAWPRISLSYLSGCSDDIAQYYSLFISTLEALQRASRLIATAAIMAADYQISSILIQKDPESYISRLWKWTVKPSKNLDFCENESLVHELKKTICNLENQLAIAQQDYVDSGSTNHTAGSGNITESQSLSERTLAKRVQKEAMMSVANDLAIAQETLASIEKNGEENYYNVHRKNALRLLKLCRTNGGVYIKVGQHLANLDLLLPEEYIKSLSSLFDDAPVSSFEDVCQVIKEEFGSFPEDLFSEFSIEPIASASLAQVHTAKCKATGKKLAIKVQHKGLRETSKGDLLAMSAVVTVAEKLFDKFNFGWICEEMTPQLPKELDFINEATNAEAAAAHLRQTGLDCVVPTVLWDYTSQRVLTMEFEEGFRATDLERIEMAGIRRRDVAKLISSVFNAQIFQNGFVHCDPHEANVLLREHPLKKGRPQIVLVDHGLYRKLDIDFQEAYARLWKGIVIADIPGMQSACQSLGVQKMYPLLAAMLTSRPFDEVIERSKTRSFDASSGSGRKVGQTGGDKAVIRGYAQKYIKEIISMLDIVPRQMLLIFKMNDCLRHVDYALGSPANTLVVAGRYASKRVLQCDLRKNEQGSIFDSLRILFSYFHVLFLINSYELWTRFTMKAE